MVPDGCVQIKGYAMPPAPVKMVTSAVMQLLGCGTEWEETKSRLASAHFKEDLLGYNVIGMKDSLLKKLERTIAQPGFDAASVEKARVRVPFNHWHTHAAAQQHTRLLAANSRSGVLTR